MDRFEMVPAIKKNGQLVYIPVIFLTARSREQDKINALNLGADDYLYKPSDPEELEARMRNLLQRNMIRQRYIADAEVDNASIDWTDFSSKLMVTIDEYITANIKEEITGKQLADITHLSERSLYRKSNQIQDCPSRTMSKNFG
ncbi:MAG: DNA-binding response OmpR family regulator [Cyclobacteriaceae bacterium]|jgi:DNA-binding response OmpR family regulator